MLATAEWEFFLPHFIDAAFGCCYQLFERTSGLDTSVNGVLANCDVQWWMGKAVQAHPDRDRELISGFFNEVHLSVSVAISFEPTLPGRRTMETECSLLVLDRA